MKRLIKWLLLLTIVLVAALTLILFNPLLIKSPVEDLLSKLTGYEVSLEGELNLSVGKELSVQATHIYIDNAARKDQPRLVSLGALKASLETASLFSDAVVLSHVQLDDALINLDTSEADVSNWVKPDKASPQDKPTKQGKSVHIKNIQINNSTLHYQQHQTDKDQVLKVSRFVQTAGQDGLLNIDLGGSFNDRAVTFSGHVGSFANIVKGRDIRFDGKGQFGPVSISGSGLIDDLIHPKQPIFDIKMLGANINDVTEMLDIDDLGEGPFDLTAHGLHTNGQYTASLEGKIGDVTMRASALSKHPDSYEGLAVKLDASGPKLGALARAFFGQHDWPDQPFSLNGEIQRSGIILDISPLTLKVGGATLSLNAHLPNFPKFDPSKATFSIVGDDVAQFRELLGIKGSAIGAFNLQGKLGLSDQNIKQVEVSLETALGKARVAGSLGAAPSYGDTRLHLNLRGRNAHEFLSLFGANALPEEPFTLESDIHLTDVTHLNTHRITLQNLKIELADTELSGEVAFNTHKPLDAASGTLQLSSHDVANLRRFPILEKAFDLFVPGQPFRLSGTLSLSDHVWDLNDLRGTIGATKIDISGVLKPAQKWIGSVIRFNVDGPGLHLLLSEIKSPKALHAALTASGQLEFTADKLKLHGFKFESGDAHANIEGSRVWPIVQNGDIRFNIDSQGSNIRRFAPSIGKFEPSAVAFSVKAAGIKHQNHYTFERFDGLFAGLEINLKGQLQNSAEDESSAHFSMKAENISTLGRFDNRPLPAVVFGLQADIHGNPDHFILEELQGHLGDSDLSGSIDVSYEGSKPYIRLKTTSNLVDIRPFLAPSKPDTESKGPVNVEQRKLIPATVLPMETLKKFDATIAADIKTLMLKADSLENVVLHANVSDGGLEVPVLTLDGWRGSASAKLTMTPLKSGDAVIDLNIQADDFVRNQHSKAGYDPDKVPSVDLVFNARGQGSNLREVVGTVNGELRAGAWGGTLVGIDLSLIYSPIFTEILSLIMPRSHQNDNTELTCAAAFFELTNGVAETNPAIAFTTNEIAVVSKGTLDFSTEQLSFGFKATPNNALKVSAGEILNSFIAVGGTLGNPVVGLDPTKVLVNGGVAIGTIGISLLARGLLDRVGNKVPVCQGMLAEMQKQH